MSQRRKIKGLARDTFWYTTGLLLRKSAGLILLPIYTAVLTTEDYGMLELANVTQFLVSIFIGFQLHSGMTWIYQYGAKDDEAKRRDAVSTTVVGFFLFGLILMVPLLLLKNVLSPMIFAPDVDPDLYTLVISGGFLAGMLTLYGDVIRNDRRTGLFNAMSISSFLAMMALQIYFVVYLKLGYYGSMFGVWLSGALILVVSLPWVFRQARRGLTWTTLKFIVVFSAPMVPASLSLWLLNLSNRFFLKEYSSLEDVGLFSVGFRVNMVMFLMLDAVRMAWNPVRYRFATGEDNQTLYPRVITYFNLLFFFAGLIFSLLARDVLLFLVPPHYQGAYRVVPIIALSHIFYISTMFLNIGFAMHKKQYLTTFWYVIATVICQFLNWLLIAKFHLGMVGAALGPTISFGVAAVGIHKYSQRYYSFKLEGRRIAVIVATAIGLFVVGSFNPTGNPWLNASYRVLVIALYVPALYMLRVFTPAEVNVIRGQIGKLRRRVFGRTDDGPGTGSATV